MAALLTKDEVVNIAFTRKIDIGKIHDKLIESVQFTHIKPILQKELFNLVIANPANYSTLLGFIKPVIAYYVKFYILPEIWIDISTTGLNHVNGNNRTVGQNTEFLQARQTAIDNGMMHSKYLTEYLNDNYSAYPEYNSVKNPENQVKIVSGFIFSNIADDSEFNNICTND